MKTIAVINQKGGTGKTTSTVSIAGCLAQFHKKRVLVFDCDESHNASSHLLSFDTSYEENSRDILSVVKGEKTLKEIIRPVSISYKGKMTNIPVSVVPSYERMEEECIFEDPYVIKNMLAEIKDDYDYVIFDGPPHMTSFAYEALASTQYVIIPANADVDSLGGFDLLLDSINELRSSGVNTRIQILGIFFTNVNPQNALSAHIAQQSIENMGDIVFEQKIRSGSVVGQARYFGKPINYYKGSCGVTRDYFNLTYEILTRIRKKERE